MEKIRVLIVDDEVPLAQAFKKKLEKEGFSVTTAASAREVFAVLKEETFDVAVLDIKLPDMEGIDLLNKLREMEPAFEIIMLTGHASVDTAIRSMKLGAYDYLTKPCKSSELSSVILKAYEKKSLKEQNILLEKQLERVNFRDKFIGESRRMKEVKKLISLVSGSDVPVLITGETGTGKELIAGAIHASSTRAAHPFVAINSSTLQENILESELFGYKRGAFTGAHGDKMGLLEIAHKGTFFVDEVGDMNLAIQAKLLRVLETGDFYQGRRCPGAQGRPALYLCHEQEARRGGRGAQVSQGPLLQDQRLRDTRPVPAGTKGRYTAPRRLFREQIQQGQEAEGRIGPVDEAPQRLRLAR